MIRHLFAICAAMEKIYRLFLLGEEREREKIILSEKSLGKRRQSCLNEDGILEAACLARRCG